MTVHERPGSYLGPVRFTGLYGRHVQVIPDFLEPCLEGELKLKGRIRLGTLLFLVFRMLQNKQIRLWVRKWRES